MSASRNLGVEVARGAYVAFLDCDDVWLPSALAHRMRVAAAFPTADIVVGGTWRWHGWTGTEGDRTLDRRMTLPVAPPYQPAPAAPPLRRHLRHSRRWLRAGHVQRRRAPRRPCCTGCLRVGVPRALRGSGAVREGGSSPHGGDRSSATGAVPPAPSLRVRGVAGRRLVAAGRSQRVGEPLLHVDAQLRRRRDGSPSEESKIVAQQHRPQPQPLGPSSSPGGRRTACAASPPDWMRSMVRSSRRRWRPWSPEQPPASVLERVELGPPPGDHRADGGHRAGRPARSSAR